MVMTEEEIASAAARRSAARRKRVTGRCEVCGAEFEGLTTRRYCSDRCRVQAARRRGDDAVSETTDVSDRQSPTLNDADLEFRDGESIVEYFDRIRGAIMRGRVFTDDSVDILRRERDARSEHLARLGEPR